MCSNVPPKFPWRQPQKRGPNDDPAFLTSKPVTDASTSSSDRKKSRTALTDANFALWQDSENTWGVRLKGQPMRTDFNLSDTGRLEVDGSWQRAANLHQTPLQFTLQWDGAQLGQATKLTVGQDKGWRGGIALSAASLTELRKTLLLRPTRCSELPSL